MPTEFVTLSVGLGLVVSLVFAEFLGAAAGGMVVPGYIALSLDRPVEVLLTVVVALMSHFLVHALGTLLLLYGRRRTVLTILVAFLLSALLRHGSESLPQTFGSVDLNVVGYIVPGLIAIWMDRQGILETLSALVSASVVVRLALILITAGEMAL